MIKILSARLMGLGAIVALGLTLGLTLGALAQSSGARVDRIDVLDAGFTEVNIRRVQGAAGATGGRLGVTRDFYFLAEPPAVTAKTGTSFGVDIVPLGARRGASATLRTAWKIPAPGAVDAKTGNVFREFGSNFTARIGTPTYRGYKLTESWEVVPGEWTMEIWQDERKLLERKFVIK
jgi:hypothetical protein